MVVIFSFFHTVHIAQCGNFSHILLTKFRENKTSKEVTTERSDFGEREFLVISQQCGKCEEKKIALSWKLFCETNLDCDLSVNKAQCGNYENLLSPFCGKNSVKAKDLLKKLLCK